LSWFYVHTMIASLPPVSPSWVIDPQNPPQGFLSAWLLLLLSVVHITVVPPRLPVTQPRLWAGNATLSACRAALSAGWCGQPGPRCTYVFAKRLSLQAWWKLHSSSHMSPPHAVNIFTRFWYLHLKNNLIKLGCKPSDHDECVFYHGTTIFIVYTDDTILLEPNKEEIDNLVKLLQRLKTKESCQITWESR
jgi:hypothetical protein